MMGLYDIFLEFWQVVLVGTTYSDLFAELTVVLIVLALFWLFIQSITLFRYKTNKTMHIVTITIIIIWIIQYFYPNGFPLIHIINEVSP